MSLLKLDIPVPAPLLESFIDLDQAILDALPDPVYAEIEQLATRPDFPDLMLSYFPELGSQAEWCKQLFTAMAESITAPEDGAGT